MGPLAYVRHVSDAGERILGHGLDGSGHLAGWVQDRWQSCVSSSQHIVATIKDEEKRDEGIKHITEAAGAKGEILGRTAQFWSRSIAIYGSYKICQARSKIAKDPLEVERLWEAQHEAAADKLYNMCVDLGGFFLKGGQFFAKPDLVPAAWVRRLSVLHDAAPATPFQEVRKTLEAELGGSLDSIFESVDERPVGSASVAQVHRGRLRANHKDVAVKVQHPGIEPLMMADLRNYKHFAYFLQKLELGFDLHSLLVELEEQVQHEFNFNREAYNMDSIGDSLARGRVKQRRWLSWRRQRHESPIILPRSVPGLVTKRVLVMDFIEGVQITRLGEEMKKRGINPSGTVATIAKKNILRDLTDAYGHMILVDGHFQADPHPGNILVCKGGKVALLDYGQTKRLPEKLKLAFAHLVLAICADDLDAYGRLFKEMGIQTAKTAQENPTSYRRMATLMFDTKTTDTITTTNPFAEEATLKDNAVQKFPGDLFFVLRTVQLLRGLCTGMHINWSVADRWKPLAEEVIHKHQEQIVHERGHMYAFTT